MKHNRIKKLFINIICAFVSDKFKRRKLRVILNANIIGCLYFIRKDIKEPIKNVKTFIGYQARSLIIGVNNKFIYKIPVQRTDANFLALREERIVKALRNFSTIYVPTVETFNFGDKIIRKYEYVHGKNRWGVDRKKLLDNYEKYGHQLGEFIYKMGIVDPLEIQDLKGDYRNTTPGFMLGWCQGDIGDNYMIDPNTMEIIAMIDWEDARFMDFSVLFNSHKPGALSYDLMNYARDEYIRLWNIDHPNDIKS
ncbi:MAG: hypothetical protein MJ187_00150 [Alphaproteobacteria bacterium]|nr:hypothetical protein [Alphaproteobacteria bacterium]